MNLTLLEREARKQLGEKAQGSFNEWTQLNAPAPSVGGSLGKARNEHAAWMMLRGQSVGKGV